MKPLNSVACAALLSLVATACGSDATSPQTKSIHRTELTDSRFKPAELEATINTLVSEVDKKPPVELQVGVVLKTLLGYFFPVAVGANRALRELNLPGQVLGPDDPTGEAAMASQIQMVEAEHAGGYQGIALAPGGTELQPAIDAAVDDGIPVITVDSDLPDSKRSLYVGTLNHEAGATAALTLEALLAQKGTVFLLGNDNEGWVDGFKRTQGAKTELEAQGYTVVIRSTDWTIGGEAADVAFLSQALLDADPPAVGMIGLFSNAYRCAMAVEMAGMQDAGIKVVAFDFDPSTVNYMRSGLISATHAQRQYYMGYVLPYVLYGFGVLGESKTKQILGAQMVDAERFNTGLDVVKADQIDEYNAFLDEIGVNG